MNYKFFAVQRIWDSEILGVGAYMSSVAEADKAEEGCRLVPISDEQFEAHMCVMIAQAEAAGVIEKVNVPVWRQLFMHMTGQTARF